METVNQQEFPLLDASAHFTEGMEWEWVAFQQHGRAYQNILAGGVRF
jgi:hypothetical protein